jgi:hypothetical protein
MVVIETPELSPEGECRDESKEAVL